MPGKGQEYSCRLNAPAIFKLTKSRPHGLVLVLCLLLQSATRAQQLVVYPAPQGIIYSQHNDDYTVRVRKPGGEWMDVFEYNVKVDADKVQNASMAYFDFSGKIEVSVRKNNGELKSVKIRPSSYGIHPVVNGNSILFTLCRPRKLSVECNGDKLSNLHLFANAIETHQPSPSDTNLIYFGPGIHTPDNKDLVYRIPSGKTVYIAGGAIVRGKLLCDSVNNVHITGRGILDQPQRGIEITHSVNVTVEGIIVVNPKHYTVYGGASRHIIIRNIKSFSCVGWSDGIDLMSCSDVAIDDVFMRNSDDCIAIYGHRWKYFGSARNYTITNSILWADVAHPINIGLHGDTRFTGDTLEQFLFKNIDILEHDEDDPDYEGCIAITDGDLNLVRNIHFEDIRIDDFEEGKLINFRTVYNKKYNTGPGKGIQGISLKNISYNGSNTGGSIIDGIDSTHIVKGVMFENLRINGKLILDAASGRITVGPFAKAVSFKK
jgi:hypothetical protein